MSNEKNENDIDLSGSPLKFPESSQSSESSGWCEVPSCGWVLCSYNACQVGGCQASQCSIASCSVGCHNPLSTFYNG